MGCLFGIFLFLVGALVVYLLTVAAAYVGVGILALLFILLIIRGIFLITQKK
jgi:hypothetical protein